MAEKHRSVCRKLCKIKGNAPRHSWLLLASVLELYLGFPNNVITFLRLQQKVDKSTPATGSPADLKEKKKERILDLSRYMDKLIRVKFTGGREAAGILKGYDPLLNIVLDNTVEYLRGKT